ncbi:TRAP transporter fused permease subunit [Marivibrio halodurans]|uniref:TRAP transporter fused permease subunit n=1 Tax=Marivibrio halodurans TaxID=2039722 RepID=A0A8J7RXC2_9PROT|nr:TRAP transporter fused permease subunit [Marivibrio halodurans]
MSLWTSPRVDDGWRAHPVALLLAAASVGFHLWLTFAGLMPNLISRPIHLLLVLPWIFVMAGDRPASWRGWRGAVDWLLFLAGAGGCLWVVLNQDMLGDQYGSLQGLDQRIIAILLILVVLEAARRMVKLALPAIAVVALAYGLLGQYLPGRFGHAGMPVDSFLGTLVVAEGGLWGPLTGISMNVVAVFVILGAVIGAGEGGTGFMALAAKLAGRLRAGAAKVSILASALFGSISGSASANVASTGAVTLPAMKRLGYPPALAAAVEAVASSGGQIMPPLMGAGAFVMVELLGVSYVTIMMAAVLPAILFFVAAWFGVELFARRGNLRGMAAEELPSMRLVLATLPFFAIPFAVLLAILFASGKTPQYAAAIAAFAATALLVTDRTGSLAIRPALARLSAATIDAARQIATIAAIIICAGLVIGVLNMTGLGVKVTSAILALSGGELWIALLLTALACLILGMEVPTTAAYVICVSVAGPALQELGLPALTVHLFVFWYALLSTITPPVCGTVFIAAGMADAPWLRVAGYAMRLGLGLYLVPLAMVANPALIRPEDGVFPALFAFAKIAVGLASTSWATVHFRDRPLLALLALAGGAVLVFYAPFFG